MTSVRVLGRLQAEDEGISLVEILVGIMIIGIALAAFASTLTQALTNISEDEQFVRANQLAADELEGIRSLEWDAVGFYANDPGYGLVAGDTATVTLGPTRPAEHDGEAFPLPERIIDRDGIDYETLTEIVWVDDPAVPGTENHKELRITLEWQVRGQEFTTSALSTRTPTLQEVPLSPPDPCTPGEITRFTVSPSTIQLSESGSTEQNVSVVVETCGASPQVSLLPRPITQVQLDDQGDGTVWRRTINFGTTQITPGPYDWEVRAFNGQTTLTTPVRFVEAGTVDVEVVSLTPLQLCVRETGSSANNGELWNATTLMIATQGEPTQVDVGWTAAAGSRAATGSADTWSVTIPAGTRFTADTSTFSVSAVRTSDGITAEETFVVAIVGTNNSNQCPSS